MANEPETSRMQDVQEIDSLFDAALSTYANPQPHPGLSAIVLRNVRRRSLRRTAWLWSLSTLATVFVIAIAGVLYCADRLVVRNDLNSAASTNAVRQTPETKIKAFIETTPAPNSNSKRPKVPLTHIDKAQLHRAKSTRLRNAFVFETTEQDRALLQAAARAPQLFAALDEQRASQAQPVQVQPIQISSVQDEMQEPK